MEKKLLEVGDVIYDRVGYFGKLARFTIERVTATQAVYNTNAKVYRELRASSFHSDKTLRANKYGKYGSVELENEELKEKYSIQLKRSKVSELFDKIGKIQVGEMTGEQLDDLIEKLNNVLNLERSVATDDASSNTDDQQTDKA